MARDITRATVDSDEDTKLRDCLEDSKSAFLARAEALGVRLPKTYRLMQPVVIDVLETPRDA